MEHNGHPLNPEETGLLFRDNFPYVLSNVSFAYGNHDGRVKRYELVLPDDPLNKPCYLLLFGKNTQKLDHSLLIRVTENAQSFLGLKEHPSMDQITRELQEAYNTREHERKRVELEIPQRGGKRWNSVKEPTYDGLKTLEIYLIQPTDGFSLAQEFENILTKHNVITPLPSLEKEGKESLEQRIDERAVAIENDLE